MINKVDEANLSECLEVIHKSFMTVAKEFKLTPENCKTNGAFMPYSKLLDDYKKGDEMYALYDDNKIAGFVQLSKRENDTYEMEKLAVLSEFRHKGFGGQLIDFVLSRVKELNGKKVTIGIIEENTRLKEWYQKNGFLHTGVAKFPHLPFTVGFMERDI